MQPFPFLAYPILAAAFVGIAVGRLPKLVMNRPTIAFTAAILLVLVGAIDAKQAFGAIDVETIALLLAMMIIVANLRLSGFFALAGDKVLGFARGPRALLGLVVVSSGLLSALFLNDTVCIMLTPLVAEVARRTGRDGRPYLIALATSANAGSCATAIGNPQNMLIAAQSEIPFLSFSGRLFPPSLIALLLCYAATRLAFPAEFGASSLHLDAWPGSRTGAVVDRRLMFKSLAAAGALLILLGLGIRTSVAAVSVAGFLLVTRRTQPGKVFGEVDFALLVFFSGLFVLTAVVSASPLFGRFLALVLPHLRTPGAAFSASIVLVSNLVSNVPAVMLLSPVARRFADPTTAWLLLALASTFAGNLTLLGSVANLIVAEQGAKAGVKISFLDYLKVGAPVTLASVAVGTFWLGIGAAG